MTSANKKPRPCLRCDKPQMTTPEWRLCDPCLDHANNFGEHAKFTPPEKQKPKKVYASTLDAWRSL